MSFNLSEAFSSSLLLKTICERCVYLELNSQNKNDKNQIKHKYKLCLSDELISKTIGGKIFKLEPISGFAADLNSSFIVFSATLLHLPVSTTHVVSGSIMGVGTAKRISAVRWGVAQQMLVAWILTIPSTAIMGSIIYKLIICIF